MNRSRRMEPVARVTEDREQKAALVLAEGQQELGEQQLRLDELHDYRREYAQRLQQQGVAGLRATELQDFRNFLDRLDNAIRQQERMVERQRHEVERRRQLWLDARTRCRAMGKVLERYRSEEDRAEERREQAENDEHARLNALRRRGN